MQDTAAIEMLKEKIDDLNYQAWNIRVQDSPKALSLCKEALDLARGINYIKGIAEGTRSLGFCYGRLSRNDEALNVLRESLTLFESLNDLDGQSNVIEYMGFISRNQGDLASSLNLLYKALSLSEQSGFLENLATNHYQLGVTYKHLGDYERALDHLYKSISLNREMNNLLYEAYSINVIGSIYFDDARYEQALEYYKQGLVVRQQSGDKWGEAGSLDNIGFTYLKLENYDEAIKYCSQSLEISTGTDDKKGQANALLHLAEIYKQKNDTVQAAKFSHDSLEIRKASGDKRGEAEIFLFLSDLHKREPEKSQLILAWLNDALKIAEEIKALDLLSKTRFHLYEYYKTGEDFKEALKNLDLYTQLEKEFHKNAIAQKVANLEISHKAETISQRNNELTQLNERIERANAELKIEGSLERVRAASMGMRHSDDLINVINVIQEQLLALGIHFHAANFVTDYSDKGYTMWLASPGESFPFKIYVSQVGQKFFDVVNAAVEKGSDFATYTLNFEEKNIYFKNLFENSLLSHISEEGKRRVFESGGMASSIVLLDKVRLNLMNLDLVPYTDEENKILKRFGYAFEQSYTRFLDLQKAEAQAKEAQIEAALERIRARAMAMHSSHELIFVANILREQMGLLGQPELETCVLSIVDENSGIISNWNAYRPPGFSGEEIVTSTSSFAIDSSELTREMIQHYKSGEKEFTLSAAGEKLHEFFGVLIKSDPQVINYMGNGVPEKVFYHFTSFAGGTLLTVSYQSPTDDVRSLQRRSAAVFDMAYRRFIDLQKAEAQAREAKIEAALERVRSRTIAMHKSGELLKIIDLVGVELNKLELPYTSTTIVTDYIPDKGFTLWLKTHGLQEPVKFFVPLFDLNFLHRLDKALQNGEEFLSYSMDEKETHSWYQHMFSNTILSHSPEELKQIRLKSLNYHISVAFLKNNVELTVGIVDGVPYTEEQNTIIKRFGKVFEQAYTRYLDLQKAEAQAREAQIEAALERVRAKVMAMNNSKDLDETSLVFGEQLRKLAIDWQFSYFWLIDEAKNENVFWITWPDYKTSFTSYTIAEAENYFNDCLIAWRGGVRIHDNFVPPNDVQAWLDTFQRIANDAGGEAKRVMVKETFPDGVFYYDAMMKYGSFGICISKPATDEEKKIQCRFAIEFERAYTRFLDLKQAEIQAREAQIEAALERVRSCSMGMQKSEELKEVIQIVFEQVVNLNINAEHAGFVVDYKPQGDWHFWIADKNEIPSKITHPYFESVWASQFNEAKEKGKDLFTTYLNFEEKNKFYQELLSYVPGIPEESKQFYLNCPALAATTVLQDNVSLYIENFSGIPYTGEENAIMLRFGKVFQQTYTRFLDLQKAEAQAREAQIETALEKIRSHTMGMRSSEDLANVATVMFDQMRILGGDLFSFGIVLCDKHEKMVEQWHSLPGTGMLAPFFVPVELDYIHQYRYDQWKNGVELFSIEIPEDYIAHHFELMLALPSVKAVWEGIATRGVPLPSIPTWEIDYGAAFRYGYLLVSSFKPFKEEKIFPRFAKVFEQAYTRFLDLQKAEAQAREAQIQLSLERVRAKAMAMYHSDELNDVLSVLFEQFDALGISPVFAHLSLFDLENNLTTLRITGKGGKKSMAQKTVAIDAMDEWKEELANWKLSKPSSVSRIYYPKEVVPQIWNLFGDLFNQLPDDARIYPADFENGLYCIQGNTGFGYIGFNHIREASEEEKEIIQRFAIEFGRVYQRFLDLQKAEAQAREAQIETGLEKVRSKTMAMHKSEEVTAIAVTLNGELLKLGFGGGSTIIIIDKETGDTEQWTGFSEDQALRSCYVPHFNHPYHDALLSAWKADEKFLVYTVAGPDKKKLDEHYFATGYKIFPDNDKKWMRDMESVTFSHAFMKYGAIHWGPDHLTDEQLKILQRFSKVFEQSYTRFLDLKKAEAQAREAEIELALERVRARTMAMQKSEELQEVVHTVFERLKELNIDFYTAIIILFEEGSKDIVWWLESKAKQQYQKTLVPYAEFSYLQDLLKARENNIDFFSKSYPFEEKNKLFHHLFTHTELKYVPQQQKEFLFGAEFATMSVSLSKNTGLHITSYSRKSFSDQDNDVFRRFAKVFDQAYTRFQDLQKAEAQARESLIELGLERVRARAMAMQNSDELGELVAILFDELTKLDLILARCIIWIFDSVSFEARMWMANSEDKRIAKSYFIKRIHHPYYDAILSGWKERKIKWVYDLKGDDKKTIDQILLNETELSQLSEAVKKGILSSEETFVAGSFNNFGLIEASGPAQPTDEQLDILNRFGKVFDLSYTRFNDLKQAEAQAREAKIETALEKVRASTMAMQKSEDLSKTAFVLFNQFKELGEAPERIFIATFDDHDNGVVDLWGTDQGGNQLNKLFKLPVNEPTMVSKIIAGWKEKRRSVVVDLKGEELKTYLRFIKQAGIPVTEGVMTERRVQTAACFSNGVIGVTTPEPQSAEAVQLQERFAGVFDLAYTRFLDLQKAEAQAHEAKIETALERVRARALAMQEPEELKEVAQVLRTEMGLLGIEELETCSIYIHEKDSETAECWYALKDPKETEKKMVADHFHLQLTETWVGREMKKFYSSDEKQTSIVMQGTNRKEWIAYCYKHSPVFAGFYGETIPDRTYHLYKFSHGYIGAAAPGDISAESWRLLSRAASVFSLAYSRFKDLTQARNDLIKLKEEKKRAEVALTELQATQKQLIQSEKMASLGELTAGIAHEIQNPLNFVNNFSDVSNELIEELKIKNEKLKIEDADVKDLLNDIAQNLEKINHHGKRADAIVKGMLQHSRSSSGQKEPTDINTLAEEYLRLAYHGLRAKDKFFNAKFETEFDPSIDKIKIVPQEIGRVILNLINNSFYAVSEKKKNTANGYEPSVTVSTKKIKDTVEIRIKDNGSGIPQKVLDKIFQPFFTTKPTGQGTGLGLSLAYDIVTKGHDGEIKVETEEGEGSEFTITLPMN